MVTRKIDLNKRNKDGLTPIHLAAKYRHVCLLKLFDRMRANFNVYTNNNESPLLLACKNMSNVRSTPEDLEVIDLLISRGCDINASDVEGYSPLHYASQYCSNQIVKKLIESGANVDCQTAKLSLTPLDCAIECSRQEVVDTLLEHGARVNVTRVDDKSPTYLAIPVQQAAECCNVELLKYYKEAGADFNACTENDETPLILACKNMYELKGTSTEIEVIYLLLDKDCKINATDKDGYSALHYAVQSCSVEVVEQLLDLGANVNCRTKMLQITPLHRATRLPHFKMVETLVKYGAEVNADTTDGITPLHLATAVGQIQIVKYLIDHGAHVNCREDNYFFSPLLIALRQGRKDLTKLLIKCGANVNVSASDGLTCMHLASKLGNVDIVNALIEAGANVSRQEKNHWLTPVHIALSYGRALDPKNTYVHVEENNLLYGLMKSSYSSEDRNHEMVFELLYKAGAKMKSVSMDNRNAFHFALDMGFVGVDIIRALISCNVDVNLAESDTHLTPLLIAAREGHLEATEELLKAGAMVNAVDVDGKNALHFAIESGGKLISMVELLLKYGADVNCKENRFYLTPLHTAACYKRRKEVIKILIEAGADVRAVSRSGKTALQLAEELENMIEDVNFESSPARSTNSELNSQVCTIL